MSDIKKCGITFPHLLIKSFCKIAEEFVGNDWSKFGEAICNSTISLEDGTILPPRERGFGLGNTNNLCSIIHYLILKMSDAEKILVRSDDSITAYKRGSYYNLELTNKKDLGIILNDKKIIVSLIGNVFCEKYAGVIEDGMPLLGYSKFAYLCAHLGSFMEKVYNSASCKFYLKAYGQLRMPHFQLLEILKILGVTIFGVEFDPIELDMDFSLGGWNAFSCRTNLKSDYLNYQDAIKKYPDKEATINCLLAANLNPQFPKPRVKKNRKFNKIYSDLLMTDSKIEKDRLEEAYKNKIPIETTYEIVDSLDEALWIRIPRRGNLSQLYQLWQKEERKRHWRYRTAKGSYIKDREPVDILWDKIQENYTLGKSGYAVPNMIITDQEFIKVGLRSAEFYDANATLGGTVKFSSLKEREEHLTNFFRFFQRTGKLNVGSVIFPLYTEALNSLESVTVPPFWEEKYEDNKDFFEVFNVPGEIAYFDFTTRESERETSFEQNTQFRLRDGFALNPFINSNLYKVDISGNPKDSWYSMNGLLWRLTQEDSKLVHGYLSSISPSEKIAETCLLSNKMFAGGKLPEYIYSWQGEKLAEQNAQREKENLVYEEEATQRLETLKRAAPTESGQISIETLLNEENPSMEDFYASALLEFQATQEAVEETPLDLIDENPDMFETIYGYTNYE